MLETVVADASIPVNAEADAEDREAWDALSLGYTQTPGDPGLRRAIADSFE